MEVGSARFDDWVEVRSGLQPGDRLVDEDPASLDEGESIRVAGESEL